MRTIIKSFLLFIFTINLYAQNSLPEFNNKPAYFNAKTNELIELEKSQYNTMAKAKGLFRAEGGFFISGISSSAKITKLPELKFIVKVVSGNDPTAILDLVKFEIRKDKRVFITTKSYVNSTSNSFEKINYEIKKIKEGYYYLIVKNLEKGEYFFGSYDFMYAFSVD